MTALNTVNVLDSIIPISLFNKGQANKIFSEVKKFGTRIVVKNNVPECILMSPQSYQQMMEESDAKYKVYLHQDTYCRNRYFLYEALEVFQQDEKIGLIGVAGCTKMPDSGVWWDSQEDIIYSLYQDSIADYGCQLQESLQDAYLEVEALDGVFLMTSKDVDWRADLFEGWHHYDVSQTKEFLLAGYKAVIARQEDIWVLHCEKCQMYVGNDYEEARQKYVKEYIEENVE